MAVLEPWENTIYVKETSPFCFQPIQKYAHHSVSMEVRNQLPGVRSLLFPWIAGNLNLSHQASVFLAAKPSCRGPIPDYPTGGYGSPNKCEWSCLFPWIAYYFPIGSSL